MTKKALEGTKILEFADFVSGPYCAKQLADLGAEVIKIEKPGTGDSARKRGPFPDDIPDSEKSGLFLYTNTNKQSITLNPKTRTGKKIFLELVKWADVLIQDKSPLEIEELELTYDKLKEINPRLIMTSITPFGQTGPYRDYKAYGLNITHSSGAGYLSPPSQTNEREPLKGGGLMDEFASGLSAAIALLGALYQQQATGIGQHIDCSKQEMVMDMDKVMMSTYPNSGTVAGRVAKSSVIGMVNLPCKDGYIMFAAMSEPQWNAVFDILGDHDWVEKFRDNNYRDTHMFDLMDHLAECVKDGNKEELYHGVQKKGAPAGIVRSAEEVVNWQQLIAREFFQEIDHPKAGTFKYPTTAYRFSETSPSIERPAPLLGEHNQEIYTKLLGYSKEEVVKLREAGII